MAMTSIAAGIPATGPAGAVGRRQGRRARAQQQSLGCRGVERRRATRVVCMVDRGGARERAVRESLAAGVKGREEPLEVPGTAEGCVEAGLAAFQGGRAADARTLFAAAIEVGGTEEELQAAYYNAACAEVKLGNGGGAVALLREALDRDLPFSVLLEDPDLAPLRAGQAVEFEALRAEYVGKDGGFSREAKLRSEAKDPFRGARLAAYLVAAVASSLALTTTLPSAVAALTGALQESQDASKVWINLAVNLGVGVGAGALYTVERRGQVKDLGIVSREETLAKLKVRARDGRLFSLEELRFKYRPLILAGTRKVLDRELKKAESYRADLLKRGLVIVPVYLGASKVELSQLPEGSRKAGGAAGFGAGGYDAASPTVAQPVGKDRGVPEGAKDGDKDALRFRVEPHDQVSWENWIEGEADGAKAWAGAGLYVKLKLEGSVDASGQGIPDWPGLVAATPEMSETLRSKILLQ